MVALEGRSLCESIHGAWVLAHVAGGGGGS